MNLEQAEARRRALTVRCPYLPCLAKPGDPCVSRDGRELISQAAHVDRMRDADVELLAVPTTVDELAEPRPAWSPTDALKDNPR